jgi:hypothetical protein
MALLSTAFLTPIRLHQHHNSSFKCSSCTHGSLRKFNISDSFLPSQLSSTIQWQSTPRHFFKHTNTPTLSNYSSLQLRSMHNSIPCTHGSVCKIQFMVLPISFPTSSTALFFQTAPSNLFLLYCTHGSLRKFNIHGSFLHHNQLHGTFFKPHQHLKLFSLQPWLH